MEWARSYETGIKLVDQQHQELFRQVGVLLGDDDKNKPVQERIEETLGFLGEYVLDHFGTEEKLMQMINYPKTVEHKKMHDDFVQTFLGLKQEYSTGNGSLPVLMKLSRVVLNWLKEHIMLQDKDFGEYYRVTRSSGTSFRVAGAPEKKN